MTFMNYYNSVDTITRQYIINSLTQSNQMRQIYFIYYNINIKRMKNLKCFKVIDDLGNINHKPCALTLDAKTKIMTINTNQIAYKNPILLQNNYNCFYLFLNESNIVAVSSHHINLINDILYKLEIGSVKVPQKQTQYLAAQMQQQNLYIHCGTYNYQHECFIIVKFANPSSIQIRNNKNQTLLSCLGKQIQFIDERQAVKLFDNIFYFWKQFQYEEIKLKLSEFANNQIQQQVFYPIQQMKQQNVKVDEIVQYADNKLQQFGKIEQKIQNKINQKLEEIKTKQTQKQMQMQKTVKKQVLMNEIPSSNRKTVKKPYQNDDLQSENNNKNQDNCIMQQQVKYVAPIKPKKLIFEDQNKTKKDLQINEQLQIQNQIQREKQVQKQIQTQKEKEKEKAQQMQIQIQIKNRNKITKQIKSQDNENEMRDENEMKDENEQIKYKQIDWKGLVCCQDQYNVIDVKLLQQKPYLFYHKFQSETIEDQAKRIQICELKQTMGPCQQWNLNPTKLIYQNSLQTVYYNDLNMGYIYSCDINKKIQQAYFTYLPVLDMSKHSDSQILALHRNQIFLFDNRQSKKNVVANYSTVHDLIKISSIESSHCYVTASSSGFVRTYDIRNHQKALNKFEMPKGITSLQISNQGSYILCGYREKAEILTCTDRTNKSIFASKTKRADRRKASQLIKGNQHLSNMQFLHDSPTEGDIIAVDDENIGSVVMKNVTMTTSTLAIPLKLKAGKVEYLNSKGDWLVYGMNGGYYRQKVKEML